MDWVFNDPNILKATSRGGSRYRLGRAQARPRFLSFKKKLDVYLQRIVYWHCQAHSKVPSLKLPNSQTPCLISGMLQESIQRHRKSMIHAWKDMNQEWLDLHSNTTIPMPLLLVILNHARLSKLLYKNEDVFTHPKTLLKEHLQLDQIPTPSASTSDLDHLRTKNLQ
ncbi:putative (-)-germacrene D synthase [Rosa chinensis]|uniref:Putative (-)-germacrene D synthase n=1 Tax=Rosa chinensis TaxID=74649 RepID=A0A2P6QSJ4_ROSCH|nr:putative (-)-germacrene D synthase [Rosa chinensis]